MSAENDGTPMKLAINTSSCHLIWPSVRLEVFTVQLKQLFCYSYNGSTGNLDAAVTNLEHAEKNNGPSQLR
jgi:hypothetical protein